MDDLAHPAGPCAGSCGQPVTDYQGTKICAFSRLVLNLRVTRALSIATIMDDLSFRVGVGLDQQIIDHAKALSCESTIMPIYKLWSGPFECLEPSNDLKSAIVDKWLEVGLILGSC